MSYQIALERDEGGYLQLHCTCADAIYRAGEQGRFCKHVQGLTEVGRLTAACAAAEMPRPVASEVRMGA
jgi:hypothetical protein